MTTDEPLSMADMTSFNDSGIPKTSMDDEIPLDKARLTLLLVNGKRSLFDFDPSTTIDAVKAIVLNQWPQDWLEQKPSSTKSIEFVYLGKFLDNNTKLKENGLLGGNATIIHLVIRQSSKKPDDDAKSAANMARCKCCIVM